MMDDSMWSDDSKKDTELAKIMHGIHILMEGCTQNLTPSQLETIQKRMKSTIKQCIFWEKQKIPMRIKYDMREFGIWLAEFITDAEEKFWENKNNP